MAAGAGAAMNWLLYTKATAAERVLAANGLNYSVSRVPEKRSKTAANWVLASAVLRFGYWGQPLLLKREDKTFDPAKTQVRSRLTAGEEWIRTFRSGDAVSRSRPPRGSDVRCPRN
jgi:hypothetical protein